jgi:hypothetical protein
MMSTVLGMLIVTPAVAFGVGGYVLVHRRP